MRCGPVSLTVFGNQIKHSFSCLIELLNFSVVRIFNAIARIVFDFNTFFYKRDFICFFCLEKLISLRTVQPQNVNEKNALLFTNTDSRPKMADF